MFLDDEEPKKKAAYPPASFDQLSVGELNDYIAWLREQIARAEGEIAKKQRAQAAADTFFKK